MTLIFCVTHISMTQFKWGNYTVLARQNTDKTLSIHRKPAMQVILAVLGGPLSSSSPVMWAKVFSGIIQRDLWVGIITAP